MEWLLWNEVMEIQGLAYVNDSTMVCSGKLRLAAGLLQPAAACYGGGRGLVS
jgi:hypothetical protein